MKTQKFYNVRVAKASAIALTLPFLVVPVSEGEPAPQPIEVEDISRLLVRYSGIGETGLGKPVGTTGNNRYELSDSAIILHLQTPERKGAMTLTIDGRYGQISIHAVITVNVSDSTTVEETLEDYNLDAIAAGGGGDYKTDVYMDGDGRVIIERLEDGSTMILDEHENPILKRNADGSTQYFDAYQSARLMISANGDITFNGNVSGVGMEQYILGLQGGKFVHGTEELTFAQVKAAVEDVNKFVYLDFANAFHLPCFIVDAEGRQSVEFTSAFVIGGEAHIERVIINEQEEINVDNVQLIRINEDGGVAFGDDCEAYSNAAFAHGASCHAEGAFSHAEGNNNIASGDFSHAEGESTKASGECSHAEGTATTASEYASHAEGDGTTASGGTSHAEGESTTASGICSHAEGASTTASGEASHSEGSNTTASGLYSHAQGMFNNPDDANVDGAFSHGCGTSDDDRKNAFLIVGSEVYVIGLGGYDGTNHTSAQSLRQIIQALQV